MKFGTYGTKQQIRSAFITIQETYQLLKIETHLQICQSSCLPLCPHAAALIQMKIRDVHKLSKIKERLDGLYVPHDSSILAPTLAQHDVVPKESLTSMTILPAERRVPGVRNLFPLRKKYNPSLVCTLNSKEMWMFNIHGTHRHVMQLEML